MTQASAPASSANLGPGFDVLALALGLRCRVEARPAARWTIDHGVGQRPDTDSDDAVLAAAKAAVGEGSPLHLEVDNDIPIGRGLGSSAAAIAAGAGAALRAVEGEPDPDHVFQLTCEIEGHPDNAAAAVYGGLVLVPATGRPFRLPIHPRLRPVVAVPNEMFLTAKARELIPETVETALAVRTVARAAALIAGFLTGDAALLAAAHGDEIHEGPRATYRPETEKLVVEARAAGALHAAWSGSGPSVVALVEAGTEGDVVEALASDDIRVLSLEVDSEGLTFSA